MTTRDLFPTPEATDQQLLELEALFQKAQKERSVDGLNVFGFGEVSIAVGFPSDEPSFVAKRLIPLPEKSRIDSALADIDNYINRIRQSGGSVLPTVTRRIERPDGQHVAYVVQPIVPRECLAEVVLTNEEPQAGHPLLVAVRDFAMECVSDEMAIDTQIPNFTWVDGQVSLLDITTPATFDSSGTMTYDTYMSKQLVLLPLRGALHKATEKVLGMYRGPHGSLTQTVVFLNRVGAQAWVEPAIETFNETLDEPIDPTEVKRRWDQNAKDFPRIKKMVQMQRAWQEKVRRTPFEYLITDSFTGEII